MRGKTPAKTEKRSFKCEHCDLSFQTAAALKSHIRAKHPEEINSEFVTIEVPNTSVVPPAFRVSKRLQLRKKSRDSAEMPAKNSDTPAGRKSQFECPICLKLFPVFFSAAKHIEKKHSSDSGDENSSNTDIKPIVRETCTSCDQLITDGNHQCEESQDNTDGGTYSCLGCGKRFTTVENFDHHVSVAHYVDVDDKAFKDISDFLVWKSTTERQVQVKYVSLSNSSDKQYYQCNYVSPKNSAEITHLCPSIITLKQTRKGVRILYYKNHHHACREYKRPTPNPTIDLDKSNTSNSTELQEKLVEIMNNVIERSAGLDIKTLRKLHNLASKMENIINSECPKNSDDENRNNNDSDGKRSTIKNNMTDDQITEVLESPRTSERMKHRSNSFTPNIMKRKKTSDTSLKENNSITKNVSPVVGKRPAVSSPSFNDSYKEFIGETNSPSNKETVSNVNTSKKPRKEIVKTKIGQFTPSPEKKSPVILKKKKSKESLDNTPNNYSLDKVDFEVVQQENDCNILVLKF